MTSVYSWSDLILVFALLCVSSEDVAAEQSPSMEAKKSRQELEKAAARGDAEAQFQLGMLEKESKPFEGLPKALPLFRKAARQGHVRAQYELGVAYFESHGDEQNLPRAEKWLKRAAEQGRVEAWLTLGHLYAEGGPCVLQDLANARECYRKASAKANREILFSLGGVYRWGRGGIPANWPRSLDYYRKAARKGHPEAQYIVGQFYQYGIGTAVDLPSALSWYRKAAQQGEAQAEEKLGWLYEHGIGVPSDRREALTWYRKSEQHGGFGWPHRVRLNDPELPKDKAVESKPDPITKDIEITLEPEKTEYEVDDVIVIAVRYRNVGKEPYSITRCHTGGFHTPFSVQDEKGHELPDPYLRPSGGPVFSHSLTSIHVFEPGKADVIRHTLNQCVHIDKPGTYTIHKQGWVKRGNKWDGETRTVAVKPIQVKVRRADSDKRQAEMDKLIKAFREGRVFPDGLTRPAEEFGGDLDILRRLVFYRDPKLMPVFLDALEQEHGGDFAETGLRALPDRAVVLKAMEQRLEHPEKYQSTALLYPYLRLSGLMRLDIFNDEPGRLDNWKRKEEIIRKYRDKALQLVQSDRSYRYGHLVPGLLGGSDDCFLIDYLIRCRPNLDLVRRCSWAIQKVKLGREHIDFLRSQLVVRNDWSVTDAAILQLVRLEGTRYLGELKARRDQFSPRIIKLLLEPVEE